MSIPPPPQGFQSNLPIMQICLAAYKQWHIFHNQFPRLSKFSLGFKIDNLFNELLEAVYSAGYAKPEYKLLFVTKASTKLDLLKFYIQVAWELKCLNHKKFASLSQPLNEIGKMMCGWLKQLKTNTND